MVVVKWTSHARSEFENAVAYLSKISVNYARTFYDKVNAVLELLKRFPEMGRRVPESRELNDKEVFIQKYRLIYLFEPRSGAVIIKMFVHGSRLLKME